MNEKTNGKSGEFRAHSMLLKNPIEPLPGGPTRAHSSELIAGPRICHRNQTASANTAQNNTNPSRRRVCAVCRECHDSVGNISPSHLSPRPRETAATHRAYESATDATLRPFGSGSRSRRWPLGSDFQAM